MPRLMEAPQGGREGSDFSLMAAEGWSRTQFHGVGVMEEAPGGAEGESLEREKGFGCFSQTKKLMEPCPKVLRA